MRRLASFFRLGFGATALVTISTSCDTFEGLPTDAGCARCHEEIAAVYGRTVSFSKSQLARAHALLRERLADGAPALPQLATAQRGLAAQGRVAP